MQRYRVVRRVASVLPATRSYFTPFVIGMGLWVSFPTMAAYQDMTSMVSGLESGNARWTSFVEKSVAGSTHAAQMPFDNADSGLSGSGVGMAGVGKVAFSAKKGHAASTPDEDRINRAEKQERVIQIAPVAPPKAFNAGSVFERTSMILRQSIDSEPVMAFATPKGAGEGIKLAGEFHATPTKKNDVGVPSYLADLVNNDKADILATAYAPPEPDYAKASPFETLLNEAVPDAGGRFIPPLTQGDHAWMETPLPASVFSAKEQQCLANAVYFEAQGESSRGQAAVAQVVLNRVRNPAYPNSICGVVYQNDQWKNRCQFSFACDGVKDVVSSQWHYRKAQDVAMAVTAGKIFIPEVGSSTHYYAQYVSPSWARTMKKMTKIGLHIFYRTYGGGWS